jgi:hypothetical protein
MTEVTLRVEEVAERLIMLRDIVGANMFDAAMAELGYTRAPGGHHDQTTRGDPSRHPALSDNPSVRRRQYTKAGRARRIAGR